jgi:hypothetical protein
MPKKKKREKTERLPYVGLVYTYFKDNKSTDRVISCILLSEDGHPLSRGLALGSYSEAPNNKKGRNIARGRARKALRKGVTERPIIRDEALEVLSACDLSVMRGYPKTELWTKESILSFLEEYNIHRLKEKKVALQQSISQIV